jgi:glucan phosphoethanolaminetransferase (alkaline phosphatase superfamily)
MTRVSEFFFNGRIGRTLGLLLFFIGLLRYRVYEYENGVVLGRWSYSFSLLILVVGLLLFVAIVESWKARRRQVSHAVSLGSVLVDCAILSWGCAYVWDAMQAADNGHRIADLNLFGSIMLILLALAAAQSM